MGLRVSNIEQRHSCRALHDAIVKTTDLTANQVLSVPCTTCGAAIGEVCELNTWDARTEPHRDRKLVAAEAVGKKLGERARASAF